MWQYQHGEAFQEYHTAEILQRKVGGGKLCVTHGMRGAEAESADELACVLLPSHLRRDLMTWRRSLFYSTKQLGTTAIARFDHFTLCVNQCKLAHCLNHINHNVVVFYRECLFQFSYSSERIQFSRVELPAGRPMSGSTHDPGCSLISFSFFFWHLRLGLSCNVQGASALNSSRTLPAGLHSAPHTDAGVCKLRSSTVRRQARKVQRPAHPQTGTARDILLRTEPPPPTPDSLQSRGPRAPEGVSSVESIIHCFLLSYFLNNSYLAPFSLSWYRNIFYDTGNKTNFTGAFFDIMLKQVYLIFF